MLCFPLYREHHYSKKAFIFVFSCLGSLWYLKFDLGMSCFTADTNSNVKENVVLQQTNQSRPGFSTRGLKTPPQKQELKSGY